MNTFTTHDHYGRRRFAFILAANNYETWFSIMRLNLISKSVNYLLNIIKTVYTTFYHRNIITAELLSKFAKLSTSEPLELLVKGFIVTFSLDVFTIIERKIKWRKDTALGYNGYYYHPP